MKNYVLKQICKNFYIDGEVLSIKSYGEGHINNTYLVETTEKKYILQRVNNSVFKNTEKVMENIAKVTEHITNIVKQNGGDADRKTLNFINAKNDRNFYIADDGSLFRMYIFIDNAICYESVENPGIMYEAARAFGQFQKCLDDFPAEKLYETIARFHDTVDRYRIFKEILAEDKVNRAEIAKEEIVFALERENCAGIIVEALEKKEIPLRVTHNDTKLNNVMMDKDTGEGICVIDLDTVMPGSLLYDFGDAIRYAASTAAEDELDLDKVSMDIGLFEEYTKGYLEELGDTITKKEAELLPMSAKILTLECGLRFLTDYLDGDNYFRIHRANHNLDRARTQFKLVYDMEQKMDEMKRIVEKYYKG